MKRRLRALGAGLLVAGSLVPAMALAPAPVLATTPVIDQRQESIPWERLLNGDNAPSDYAQTFTVGRTGTLMTVALWLFTNGAVTVNLAIHPLNAAGFPTGAAYSTGYAPVGTTDGFFLFAMQPVYFTAGQHLAIVIHPVPNPNYRLVCRYSNVNPYKFGMAEEYSNGAWRGWQLTTYNDFAFRTYVVPATPTPTPFPTLPPPPTPHFSSQPTQAPVQPTLAATPSAEPTATPTETPAATPVAAETPTAIWSSEVAGAYGSSGAGASGSATTSGTSPPGSPGSGATNDMPLPAILAATAALIVVVGGVVFFFLVRRRRKPEET